MPYIPINFGPINSSVGHRFIYDNGRNRPFKFKVDEMQDKSKYEIPEVVSWCFFGLITNLREDVIEESDFFETGQTVDYTDEKKLSL